MEEPCNNLNSSIKEVHTKHNTHTKWIVWYHNPSDKNWNLDSYKDIVEISSIEDFWVLKNSWDKCLPTTSEGMFFLMRKLNEKVCIYPQWEDKHNVKGGYWSFKVTKEKSDMAWFELMMFMIGECIATDPKNSLKINGISVSPKKNFCILKIWNNSSSQRDKELLSKKLTFLNMDEVMYSAHSDNIQKDANKFKRREAYRNKRNNNRSYGNFSRSNNGYRRNRESDFNRF